MKFSLFRLDVEFQHTFAQPVFKVPKSAVEILECLYEKLNPKYPVAIADLTATAALSMGDVAIRTSLFEGKGLIEVGVEKFVARFEGLRTAEDIKIIQEVITLSEEALQSALPKMRYKGATIRSSAWLICEGTERSAEDLLDKYGRLKNDLSPRKFGAKKVKNSIRSELVNEEAGWSINVSIERSLIPGAQLFVLCSGTYIESDKFKGFQEQASHYENVYRALLAHYGLEPVTEE